MIVHDIEQRSPAWHALRFGRLTSTRCASALGYGYDSPSKVWKIITGRETDEITYHSPAIQHGIETEDVAVVEYQIRTGIEYASVGFAISDRDPWLCASPDRVETSGSRMLEVKCPWTAGMPQSPTDIKPGYIIQCSVAAYCLGLEQTDLLTYVAEGRPDGRENYPLTQSAAVVWRIHHSREWLEQMINALRAWYTVHIVGGLEPERKAARVWTFTTPPGIERVADWS